MFCNCGMFRKNLTNMFTDTNGGTERERSLDSVDMQNGTDSGSAYGKRKEENEGISVVTFMIKNGNDNTYLSVFNILKYSKHFTCINSICPQSSTMELLLSLPQFCSQKKMRLRMKHLIQVTPLVSRRDNIQIQSILPTSAWSEIHFA